jgi:hypothetical protein
MCPGLASSLKMIKKLLKIILVCERIDSRGILYILLTNRQTNRGQLLRLVMVLNMECFDNLYKNKMLDTQLTGLEMTIKASKKSKKNYLLIFESYCFNKIAANVHGLLLCWHLLMSSRQLKLIVN